MPDTDRVSSVIAVRSARLCCATDCSARRDLPTRKVKKTNIGTRINDMTVSLQDSTHIATKLEAMITTFERMLEAVSVTMLCTPATSLVSRDWISPVRVDVKKRIDRDCRCA